MPMTERKKWFVFGSAIAILPVVLWIALPGALFAKLALRLNVDDRLVSVYAFLLGSGAEIVAVYFLNRSYRRPCDWLSATAFVTAFLSALATFIFFGAATAVAMQGW